MYYFDLPAVNSFVSLQSGTLPLVAVINGGCFINILMRNCLHLATILHMLIRIADRWGGEENSNMLMGTADSWGGCLH